MSKKVIEISPPLSEAQARNLKAGDELLITGTIYTSRDAAHKRICEAMDNDIDLPFELEGSVIYYVGPTPGSSDQVVGAAGPTTSYRMDAYSPKLIAKGQRVMIGKGSRNEDVIDSMKKYGAVYCAAIGGAGALLARCIKKCEIIAYDDLGAEAVRKLYVEDFPVVVAIDSSGNSLY